MFDRAEVKSLVAQMISSGNFPSYLAISANLSIEANIIRELFREIQIEWEMEMHSWLVDR